MSEREGNLTHRKYFKVAMPLVLTMITQPILGIVDTAVIGNLNNPVYLGGVSIGAAIFNTIYWVFGFLRISTVGYSAQALGRGNTKDKIKSFIHPLVISLIIGLSFVLLQIPIWEVSKRILIKDINVEIHAESYYRILIWGAPFVLVSYVITGWLMGQAKIKETVIMQVFGNIVNIILDLFFVKYLNMNVGGVAIATLISQVVIFILGIKFVFKYGNFKLQDLADKSLWEKNVIKSKLMSNSDLMLRTICLLIVNNLFLATTSSFGVKVLAANTILLQIESIIAYIFEGLGNTSNVFAGQAVGKKSNGMLKDSIIKNLQWTLIFAIITTICYIIFSHNFIKVFTNNTEVIEIARKFEMWLIPYSFFAGIGFTFYGIFNGAMETRAIRNSTFSSMMVFVFLWFMVVKTFENHGLWFSYIIYYLLRSSFLLFNIPKIKIKET